MADLQDCCSKLDPAAAEADLEDVIEAASQILYALTGRQFSGACERVIRPCNTECVCGCGHENYSGCSGCCPPRILLGDGPVTEVTEVLIDGDVIPSAEYEIQNGRWLVRLADADGNNESWPCRQRLDLATTEDDTFQVSFTEGRLPETMGILAVRELACQLAIACNLAAGECKLPERVTSITRQGVSMALLDPQDFLEEGRTGLYLVDLFIRATNPAGVTRRASVHSPDIGYHTTSS